MTIHLAASTDAAGPGEWVSRVERARRGDAEAFGDVVAAMWPELVRLARVMLAGDDAAEDVVQEALLDAWRGCARLRSAASFEPWLRRIVWRRCLRAARARPAKRSAVAVEEAPAVTGDVLAALEVERLLRALAPRQRAVLYLSEVAGWTEREIAARLDLALPTVRVHRFQARRRLRRLLEDRS